MPHQMFNMDGQTVLVTKVETTKDFTRYFLKDGRKVTVANDVPIIRRISSRGLLEGLIDQFERMAQ